MKNYWIIVAVDYAEACAPVMHGSPDFFDLLDDGVSSDIMLDVFDSHDIKHDWPVMAPGLYKINLDWWADLDADNEPLAYCTVKRIEQLLEFPHAA